MKVCMKKILVIAPAWVGDAVMAEPLYRQLANSAPNTIVDVFAPAWTLPLIARMPSVRQAHLNPFGHGVLDVMGRRQLGHQLRQEAYQQAILLQNSIKSALVPFFAGIPQRTGFVGEFRYGLVNDIRTLDKEALPSMLERFMALGVPAGSVLKKPLPEPRLVCHRDQAAAAAKSLGLGLARPVVALCPGAEYGPAKRWPSGHFAQLARSAVDAGCQVWIFGSPKDQTIGAEIAQAAERDAVYNLTGATSLDVAIDLMSLAHVAVCNDSGLMHIAAALGIQLVALYGSSSPEFTPPLTQKADILSLGMECSPCFKRDCPLGHLRCLKDLQPTAVWQAVQNRLEIEAKC